MFKVIGGVGLALAVTACAPTQQQLTDRGRAMVAAGFVAHPADTASRRDLLAQLPPDQFIRHGGQSEGWVYADPTVCRCVYTGDGAAYERFRGSDTQSARAGTSDAAFVTNTTYNWDAYGPWGSRYDFPTRFGF